MKIVALHTDFRIYWPARLKALSDALSQRGDSLDVVEISGKGSHYSFAGKNAVDGLRWHILFPESRPEELTGKQIQPMLFQCLLEIRPDVIIAGAIAFPSGALAVRWGQQTGCRIVVFDDSKVDVVPRGRITNFIKKAIYNGVDAMFYPAEDWIPTGNFWGFKQNEMSFGVDVVDNEFWSRPRMRQNKWGAYFVAVGRQIPKKNYITIAEAYAKYVEKVGHDKAYNLVLIGDGPEHRRIAEFVDRLGLTDKVFLLPFLSQEDLPSIFQNAKALLSSSNIEETWGLVINEAMACGCPIFASYECGASNVLVKDGVNGYRFHFDDVRRQTECMVTFHNLDSECQERMRKASRRIISDWGLSRFSAGAINAIDYVIAHSKRKTTITDKLIINFWKGQYRPI